MSGRANQHHHRRKDRQGRGGRSSERGRRDHFGQRAARGRGNRNRQGRRGNEESRSSIDASSDHVGQSHARLPTVPREAARMLAGETQFPSRMSYLSEAQGSDVATVGSGSVIEDLDVESIHSGGDGSHQAPQEFPEEGEILGSGQDADVNTSSTAAASSQFTTTASLSRSQDEQDPSSTACDDADSLLVEAPSIDEERSVHSHGDDNETGEGSSEPLEGSLDDRKPAAIEEDITVNPLTHPETEDGGRRSPGGTIYKGRGTRRYQGRHMHLPLKRFHEGTSAQFPAARAVTSVGLERRQGNSFIPGYDPRLADRPIQADHTQHRDTGQIRRSRTRSRSRSRSQSPSQTHK